jgi:MYXO-CTERM domain-containing protein
VHETTSEESNGKLHTAQDTLALSDGKADHSLHFARYSVAFMAELAKGNVPAPPECDETRPCDAGAACQDGKCIAPVGGAGGAAAGGGGTGGAFAGAGAGGPGVAGTAPVSGAGMPAAAGGSTQAGVAGNGLRAAAAGEAEAGCACRAAPPAGSRSRWALLALFALGLRRCATAKWQRRTG